jgi:hypothetical protein
MPVAFDPTTLAPDPSDALYHLTVEGFPTDHFASAGKTEVEARVSRLADLVEDYQSGVVLRKVVLPGDPPKHVWPQAAVFVKRFFKWFDKKDGLAPP